jgi:hypothetical protein
MSSRRWVGVLVLLAACCLTGCGDDQPTVKLTGDFQLGDLLEVEATPQTWADFKTKLTKNEEFGPWGVFLDGHFVGRPTVVIPPEPNPPKAGAPLENVVLRMRLKPANERDSEESWRRVLEGKYPVNKKLSLSVSGRAAGDPRLRLARATKPTGDTADGTKPTSDASDGDYIRWAPFQSLRCLIAGGFVLAAIFLVIFLIKTRYILRDSPPPGFQAFKMPFSLSKTQMLVWVTTVPIAALLVWAMTGAPPGISVSVLALLGIGVGTRVISGAVDDSADPIRATLKDKLKPHIARLATLQAELEALNVLDAKAKGLKKEKEDAEVEITDLEKTSSTDQVELAALRAKLSDPNTDPKVKQSAEEQVTILEERERKLAKLKARIAAIPAELSVLSVPPADIADRIEAKQEEIEAAEAQIADAAHSKGWFTDILSDGEGAIGIHRLQLVLWTGVMWLFFGAQVLRNLIIPELDPTLITLSGVSSASYLVLKSRERG